MQIIRFQPTPFFGVIFIIWKLKYNFLIATDLDAFSVSRLKQNG